MVHITKLRADATEVLAFLQWKSAQTFCGRENFAIRRLNIWKTPYQRLSRGHFLSIEGKAVTFRQGSLPPFPHCKKICLRILHYTLGMKKFHLHWVPHALDTNHKAERATLSDGILSVLRSTLYWSPECHHWRWIMSPSVLSPWFDLGVISGLTRWSAKESVQKLAQKSV
jgi:hypothetical protein